MCYIKCLILVFLLLYFPLKKKKKRKMLSFPTAASQLPPPYRRETSQSISHLLQHRSKLCFWFRLVSFSSVMGLMRILCTLLSEIAHRLFVCVQLPDSSVITELPTTHTFLFHSAFLLEAPLFICFISLELLGRNGKPVTPLLKEKKKKTECMQITLKKKKS